MDYSQCVIAVGYSVDYDPHGQQIVDLIERDPAKPDFFEYRIEMLGSSGDLVFDAGRGQGAFERRREILDILFAFAAAVADFLFDIFIVFRIEIFERQILQLPLNAGHAESVGQGCVNLARFHRDTLLLFRRQMLQGSHVVKPVGQLDDYDPDIPGHGKKHLAEIFHLLLGRAFDSIARYLGQAVDHLGDFLTEIFVYLVHGGSGVLDNVVQQPRGDRLRVHMEFGQYEGDVEAMFHVGVARFAELPGVRTVGEFISLSNKGDIDIGVVRLNFDYEFRKIH